MQISVDIGMHIISDYNVAAPETMAHTFTQLEQLRIVRKETATRMIKAVGFRNMAIHEYRDIDWNIVYSIMENNINDFVEYVKDIEKSIL